MRGNGGGGGGPGARGYCYHHSEKGLYGLVGLGVEVTLCERVLEARTPLASVVN